MDVANLLSHDPPRPSRPQQAAETAPQETQRLHQYPTRHSVMSNNMSLDGHRFATPPVSQTYGNNTPSAHSLSPTGPAPKNVAFELLFDGATNHRARLPMRVQIFPHDNTDSIVTTVKNFYGLYEGAANGVSFEDDRGNTLIARYENFQNNMVVYVRVVPDLSQAWHHQGQNPNHSASPITAQRLLHLDDEGCQMPPPQPSQILNYGQPMSRPASRVSRKQSASPHSGRGRRSISAQKVRSRSGLMSREDSFQGQLNDLNSDTMKGYSSSDGEGGSVTSSFKARSEQLASAEISMNNVLRTNRRKRAKFESSVSDISSTEPSPCDLTNAAYLYRSYLCSCHLRCLPLIPFPPSLHRGAPMHRIIPLHSPAQPNDNLPTASLYSLHRAMATASTRMELFHKANILRMRLLQFRLDVVFVNVQTHQVCLLACQME